MEVGLDLIRDCMFVDRVAELVDARVGVGVLEVT